MDDSVDGVRGSLAARRTVRTAQDFPHQLAIPNVPVHEAVPPLAIGSVLLVHVHYALEVAGVCQEIEVDDPDVGIVQGPAHEVRADEASAARDEQGPGSKIAHVSASSYTGRS